MLLQQHPGFDAGGGGAAGGGGGGGGGGFENVWIRISRAVIAHSFPVKTCFVIGEYEKIT